MNANIPTWILESLCYYDSRNPDSCVDEEDKTIGGNKDCFCDNCCHGKTKLAEYIIEILKKGL